MVDVVETCAGRVRYERLTLGAHLGGRSIITFGLKYALPPNSIAASGRVQRPCLRSCGRLRQARRTALF